MREEPLGRRVHTLLQHPLVIAAALKLGVNLGQDTSRYRRREIGRREFQSRAGTHLGSISGTLLGTAAGAWIGSRVPAVGKIIGSLLGGFLGDVAGEHCGRIGAHSVERLMRIVRAKDDEDEVTGDGSRTGSVADSDPGVEYESEGFSQPPASRALRSPRRRL